MDGTDTKWRAPSGSFSAAGTLHLGVVSSNPTWGVEVI